jgi:hypothetical protein
LRLARVLAVLAALVVGLVATIPTTVAAAALSSAKVVIIVGADTPQYLDDADQLYAEAIQHSSNVIRVYSPNATWSAVKTATTGANVVIYLGHGNGWPSPYTFDPNYTTKDGFGLNATAAGTHGNLKYYGEPSIKTLSLAPNAVVFLFHLCYASGNSEPGKAEPTLTVAKQRAANYASAFIAAGAAAVIADGHSHNPWYLRELFTKTESLSDLWHRAPSAHGHDIYYPPVHTTTNTVILGTAILDPDNGPSSPSGFYRAFTGQADRSTSSVIGKPPSGVVVLPSRTGTTSLFRPAAPGVRMVAATGRTLSVSSTSETFTGRVLAH